jgi:DNA-binding transcriptional MerR regulator
MDSAVSIGVIAEQAGVSVATVRYYDDIGLITAVGRVGGKRRFDQDAVGRVNFIRRCQATGFSLEEIGQILDDSSGHWKPLISAKVVELQRSRDELDRMIAMLEEVGRCGCSVVATCDRMPPLTRER